MQTLEETLEPFFVQRFPTSGKLGMPLVCKQDVMLEDFKLIRFSSIVKAETQDTDATVHFFEYDNLGAMLGDMDTTVWVPAEGEALVSGDPAVFAEDWTNAWKRIVGEGVNGTERQVFWVAKNLLDYYTQQVDYDLGDAETYLKERLGLVRIREHKAS